MRSWADRVKCSLENVEDGSHDMVLVISVSLSLVLNIFDRSLHWQVKEAWHTGSVLNFLIYAGNE